DIQMKKHETVILLCTAASVIFVLGFWSGRKTSSGNIEIHAETLAEQTHAASATAALPATDSAKGQPVNINKATAEELTTLDGIGEVLAGRIIAYREKHGAFKTIAELMNVQGIAEKKYDAIKDYIIVK
ncbi:MAG: helix-hairpin-helix domain-containing protein, partial [Clostridiales bacterium]|nr:helix-hairpin-helix domain-containing protein [Clostridiales bacterium]